VVVGCGGTGSRLVPLLAQFIRSISREFNPRGWLEAPIIYLIDDDIVEHKNLLRQNFIEADVGKHKAIVLAQRYSRAYGVRIVPSIHRVLETPADGSYSRGFFNNTEGCPTASEEYRTLGSNCMYLLCVDSVKARKDILKTLEACVYRSIRGSSNVNQPNVSTAPFVIDAGNEDNFGQVQFFSMIDAYNQHGSLKEFSPEMTPVAGIIPGIPFPRTQYAEMTDTQSTASCADLDQTLAINALMATTMLGVVQNFYYVKPFTFNRIGISLEGGNYTTFNTLEDLESRMVRTSPKTLPTFNGGTLVEDWFLQNTKKLAEFRKAAEVKVKPLTVGDIKKVEEATVGCVQKVLAPASPMPRELPSLTQITRVSTVSTVDLQPLVARAHEDDVEEEGEEDTSDEPF
jgi:hypothetical protein